MLFAAGPRACWSVCFARVAAAGARRAEPNRRLAAEAEEEKCHVSH